MASLNSSSILILEGPLESVHNAQRLSCAVLALVVYDYLEVTLDNEVSRRYQLEYDRIAV